MKDRIILTFVGIVFILVSQIAGVGHAFNLDDLTKIKNTNTCVVCDLSGADLSGLNLQAANLSGSDLSGANLSNAWLTDANLSNANLSKTNLSGATLDGAIWTDGKKCADGSVGTCNK